MGVLLREGGDWPIDLARVPSVDSNFWSGVDGADGETKIWPCRRLGARRGMASMEGWVWFGLDVDRGFWYSLMRVWIAWMVERDCCTILDQIVASGRLISVNMLFRRSSK